MSKHEMSYKYGTITISDADNTKVILSENWIPVSGYIASQYDNDKARSRGFMFRVLEESPIKPKNKVSKFSPFVYDENNKTEV